MGFGDGLQFAADEEKEKEVSVICRARTVGRNEEKSKWVSTASTQFKISIPARPRRCACRLEASPRHSDRSAANESLTASTGIDSSRNRRVTGGWTSVHAARQITLAHLPR